MAPGRSGDAGRPARPGDDGGPGTLVLCGAPIGDPGDASPRLAAILASADVVAAEDTRRVRRLAAHLGVTIGGRIVSCFDANEAGRATAIVDRILAGDVVALVTDAGMPAVSDPGYRVVAAAVAAGVRVTVVPGPSAVTAALALSGLPSDRWVFEGFLPRRTGERRSTLAGLAAERRTIVLLESPRRVAAALDDLAEAFGAARPAVLCREITKTFEEIVRGTVGDLVAWAAQSREIRGEITIVIGGAPAHRDGPPPDGPALAAAVREREDAGLSRKAAILAVASDSGVHRRIVYAAVIDAKG